MPNVNGGTPMNLPVGITTVLLNGHLLNSDGSPSIGFVDFTPATAVAYTNSDSVLLPKLITVALDSYGKFSLTLPATDDPAGNPIDWSYLVKERCPGGRTFSAKLPMVPAIADYTDMVSILKDLGDPAQTVYTVTNISIVNGGTP